ncbi:class F sortase [Candidatus Saccharibacteria bacterium]|nr:class F sortase [Candidatus Saccharibacteria bacterium]
MKIDKKSKKKSKKEKALNPEKQGLVIREPKETHKMNLGKGRSLIGKILLGVILFALAFFFAYTAIWEYHYYGEKEGSERRVVETVEAAIEAVEVDETEVTDEQRREHTVAPLEPRYLSIGKLGIVNARVLSMGVNKSGELDTPYGIFDVGWYRDSSKPGGGGTLVMDGHNGGPNVHGIFKELYKLDPGDEVIIERGDGTKFTYIIKDNVSIPLAEADDYMEKAFKSPVEEHESLTLISCDGGWNLNLQTYDHRRFARAVLAD